MTDLTRLRAVLRGQRRPGDRPAETTRRVTVDLDALAAGLGGALEAAPLGPSPVVRSWLGDSDDEELGAQLRQAAPAVSETGLRVLAGRTPEAPWSGVSPTAGLVFVDLETTGLSGGSGTVAFVVGLGCFEGSRFHVWQFVLPSFGGERRLLAAVTAALGRAHTLVTFNGKSFDVPFLETRWQYHRLDTPLTELRHLDLLHPARRFWGPDTGGLGGLEGRVLRYRRSDDVPGVEIPSRYFAYLRSGDPTPLHGVLAHNRRDLASLAVLTGLACRLVDEGPTAAADARQCLGLGRVYERAGRRRDAEACYERAAGVSMAGERGPGPAAPEVRSEALYRLAIARRRQRRFGEAAGLWERLLDLDRTPGLFEREALRALAVHHEHRSKDASQALVFARRVYAVDRTPGRRRDTEKRLARLTRRLATEALPSRG